MLTFMLVGLLAGMPAAQEPLPGTPIHETQAADDDVTERRIEDKLDRLIEMERQNWQREEEHWGQAKTFVESKVTPVLVFIGKYVAPAVAGWLAAKYLPKHASDAAPQPSPQPAVE